MPQLAPVNWLLLFMLFWSVVMLSVTLIWWTSKTQYIFESTVTVTPKKTSKNMTWNW